MHLQWEPVKYFNNKIICDLIEGRPSGIISYLDEECLLGKATDITFVRASPTRSIALARVYVFLCVRLTHGAAEQVERELWEARPLREQRNGEGQQAAPRHAPERLQGISILVFIECIFPPPSCCYLSV